MLKLKELDANILRLLLKDGRTGYDELADKCRVTRNVAWKRCKAMEKKDIIKGATVQINFSHFGFDAIATPLLSVNAQKLKQIMEHMKKITEVRAYRQYYSVYNIRAIAILRNLKELDQIKQSIKHKVPTIGLKTYIWTGVRNIPENLNLTGVLKNVGKYKQWNLNKAIYVPKDKTKIDELDKQIVAKLTSDGAASFTRIAKQIGVSTDTIIKRYHKLRKRGTIRVTIQINPNKIGFSSILDFNIAFSTPGSFTNPVVESLSKIPNILTIARTSGDYDLQGTAMIRSIYESFSIQDQIARSCGITKVETSSRKNPDKWPTPQHYISTF